MSSSIKPISAAQLMDECSPANKQYAKVLWHKNKTISVRKFISANEMIKLVNDIVDIIMPPGENVVAIEIVDFATRVAVVNTYAAVDMPDSLDSQYELLYTTDLYETVCKHISQSQLNSILDSVSRIISSIMQSYER